MIIIIICYRCMNVVLERYESTSTVAVSYVLFTIGAISSGTFITCINYFSVFTLTCTNCNRYLLFYLPLPPLLITIIFYK